MNKKRPVNLALTTMKFPPMAIASILHRLSGVFLFLMLPALLYVLHLSLESEDSFEKVSQCLQHPFCKLMIWLTLSALFYHLLAGIRHMFMDFGFGEHVKGARLTASLLILVSVLLSILIGAWLW